MPFSSSYRVSKDNATTLESCRANDNKSRVYSAAAAYTTRNEQHETACMYTEPSIVYIPANPRKLFNTVRCIEYFVIAFSNR